MYDGPNYNPPDVQQLAPGQPPLVQQQIKATRDAGAWALYQKDKERREASSDYQPSPEYQAAESRAWMAFILQVCFGRLGRYLGNRILHDRAPRGDGTLPGPAAPTPATPIRQDQPTPLLQRQGFRVYCTIVGLFLGFAALAALAYGEPGMAVMWGFLLVSLIGLPFIVARINRQGRSLLTDMMANSPSQRTSRPGSADHYGQSQQARSGDAGHSR
jgi:hypothetical protein